MMTSRSEIVPIGEFRISSDAKTELVTVTGSCVALALYDAEHQIAGMSHIVLPGRRKTRRPGDQNAFFADTGVPLLVEDILRHGADRRKLKATIAGGGALLSNGDGDIGHKNVVAVIALLKKEDIPIIKTDVGGKIGRHIAFSVATGQAKVRFIQEHLEDQVLSKKQVPQTRRRANTETSALGRTQGLVFPANACFIPATASSQEIRALNFEVSDIPKERVETLISQLASLKPNATYAKMLLKAMHGHDINWEKVRWIVSRCLVLSLHVFRIANSPYYGLPGQISSFGQALTLLGARQFRRVCVLASVARKSEHTDALSPDNEVETKRNSGSGMCKADTDHPEFPNALLSQHCLATAVIARYLAGAMTPQFQENVFTAGLLHGIGSLCSMFLNGSDPEKWAISHSQLGSLVLSTWKIPDHIASAVSSYEVRKTYSQKKEDPPLAAYVHTGCGISRLLEITTPLEPAEYKLSPQVLNGISLQNGLSSILSGVFDELKSRGLLNYLALSPAHSNPAATPPFHLPDKEQHSS